MGLRSWLGLTTESAPPSAELVQAHNNMEVVTERMAELELALEDGGWQQMLAVGNQEFSRAGLGRAAAVARIMAIANPLIKRGLNVRQAYVWGQGVAIQADDEDVNTVIQACIDDPMNQAAVFGSQAQEENERALGTDGNVFFALFTKPLTGRVQVRKIPFDQILDIITNPEDRQDVWFYERTWVTTSINNITGAPVTETRTEWYPAVRHNPGPAARPPYISGKRVHWDSPIVHVRVNGLNDWPFGIGDAYAALSWARAYKDFLGDWAVLMKALSRFAWKATSKKSKAQNARTALNTAPTESPTTGEPLRAGATALMSPDQTLEAVPKTGATIDAESGKPLAAMVAAALDISVISLLSDPGQTGARAVAETLDLPTRLAMTQRRTVWASTLRTILSYTVDQAIKAPRGQLRGTAKRDLDTGEEVFTLAGDGDRTIEVTWPPLDEVPVGTLVAAIAQADSTERMPAELTAKLLMQALGVEDVDEILAEYLDADGHWIDPNATKADPYDPPTAETQQQQDPPPADEG